MHVGVAQTPAVQVALQQSLERAHAWVALRQTSCAHTPAAQDWLQQSEYALQAAPPARHFPAGTGLLPPAPSPAPGPSTVVCASFPKPAAAPLPCAHPWPDRATSGTASSSVANAQARPSERKSSIGTPLASLGASNRRAVGSNVGVLVGSSGCACGRVRAEGLWIVSDPPDSAPRHRARGLHTCDDATHTKLSPVRRRARRIAKTPRRHAARRRGSVGPAQSSRLLVDVSAHRLPRR